MSFREATRKFKQEESPRKQLIYRFAISQRYTAYSHLASVEKLHLKLLIKDIFN
jgi:hypothetical protein